MIFLYTTLLLLLGAAGLLVKRRVARLEKKYVQAARAVDQLSKESVFRDGNRLDACKVAKRQYLLGLAVQKRDRLETRHEFWQSVAERFDRQVRRVRDWQGKKLPYTLGVVDVACVLTALDYFGMNEYVSPSYLVELAREWLAR